jgi:hypothetical protein
MLPHYSVSRSCTQPSLGGSTYGVQQWQAGSIPQDDHVTTGLASTVDHHSGDNSVPYAPTSLAPSSPPVRVRTARIRKIDPPETKSAAFVGGMNYPCLGRTHSSRHGMSNMKTRPWPAVGNEAMVGQKSLTCHSLAVRGP